MKRKMVIKVCLNCQKSRCKAMKTAVCVSGVESVALVQDKNQMEVIGDEVDAANLAFQLRKHVGHAELISVSDVGESKTEPSKPAKPAKVQPMECASSGGGAPQYIYYEVNDPCHQYPDSDCCSIM